jgi:hypothetical protein
VKRQQLFHSFLPGFTVVVLTTQPAWANVVNMSEVQLGSYPNVLISTNSGNSFTNNSVFPTSNLDIEGVKILKKDDVRFVNFSDLSNHNFLAVNSLKSGNFEQQFTSSDTRVSELLESSKCPQQKSQAALLLASNTCLPKKLLIG